MLFIYFWKLWSIWSCCVIWNDRLCYGVCHCLHRPCAHEGLVLQYHRENCYSLKYHYSLLQKKVRAKVWGVLLQKPSLRGITCHACNKYVSLVALWQQYSIFHWDFFVQWNLVNTFWTHKSGLINEVTLLLKTLLMWPFIEGFKKLKARKVIIGLYYR